MDGTVIQTAFKFDREFTVLMKERARALGKSVNGYVRGLIEKDLAESDMLPQVSIETIHDEQVLRLSGILGSPDLSVLEKDPRAKAIWER